MLKDDKVHAPEPTFQPGGESSFPSSPSSTASFLCTDERGCSYDALAFVRAYDHSLWRWNGNVASGDGRPHLPTTLQRDRSIQARLMAATYFSLSSPPFWFVISPPVFPYFPPLSSFPCTGLEELQVANLNIKAFDLGGHHAARQLWSTYFPSVNAIIYLVDAVDRERFPESKAALDVSVLLLLLL